MKQFGKNMNLRTGSQAAQERLVSRTGWMYYADYLCVWLLVLCPLLQHYRGLVVDARATAMVLVAPYVLVRLWMKNTVRFKIVLPMIVYGIFRIIHGGFAFSDIGREGLVCFFLVAVESGIIDTKRFFRALTVVSVAASVVIIVQYICYYVFGFHLQVVVTDWFLKSSEQWIGLAQTGAVSITGKPTNFYRPSAFFLEPSHMALYCTPAVLLLLLSPGMTKLRLVLAALVSVGVVASTSGMGIVMCVGLWLLYLTFYCGEGSENKSIGIGKLRIKGFKAKDIHFKGFSWKFIKIKPFTWKGFTLRPINVVMIGGLMLLVVLMYLFVDVFRSSINRILFTDGGYNAILGRTKVGAYVVGNMDAIDLIFGERNPGKEADWYMSAFFDVIYRYGLIGFVLSYVFYTVTLFKVKREYRWMALLVLGLSFFSVHTHGSAFMPYLCTVLLAGRMDVATDRDLFPALQLHPIRWIRKETRKEEQ